MSKLDSEVNCEPRLYFWGQVGDSRWSSLRYKGIVHTLITIGREEGLTSIYRGLSPALVRQSVYGTIKFGLYYSSKDVAKRLVRQPQKESTLVNLCCAVVAGSVSATLATPTDVIKVRMQSGNMHKGANISWSLLSVGKVVLRHEGIRGLWRGGLPTAQRAALVAGVQVIHCKTIVFFVIVESLHHLAAASVRCHQVPDACSWCAWWCSLPHGSKVFYFVLLKHFQAPKPFSVLAGLFACIASNPVDVVSLISLLSTSFPKISFLQVFKNEYSKFRYEHGWWFSEKHSGG